MARNRPVRDAVSRKRYRRIAIYTLAGMLLSAMLLPLGGYVYVGIQDAIAQSGSDANPRSNLWREVRDGKRGYSSVTGRPPVDERGEIAWMNRDADVLINNGGQNWRQLRNGVIAERGGWLLALALFAGVFFFIIRGAVKVEGGRAGRVILRWSWWERAIHWYTATLFTILTITGLSLLFGRAVLIPLLGPRGFAAWAETSHEIHNLLGPWFGIGVALMVVFWFGHNIPTREDLEWFKKGGGIIGKGHPSAGFANAGEKVWFWFIVVVGGLVIITGLAMAGVIWSQGRDNMQLATLVHGAGSLLWIALWFGHAYIGTIGTEGAIEGMTSGYVDENWAKQHHDGWYETVKDKAVDAPQSGASASPDGQAAT